MIQVGTNLGFNTFARDVSAMRCEKLSNVRCIFQEWQKKWERDMRPVPAPVRLDNLPHLRAWNSMPLPTNDIEAYFIDWQESYRRTSKSQLR